ncbi:MAG: peptide ABC transporter substrate-binding protein [Coprococcus sp.]|nr:peptide ABC transporter substrate-binding protein [Coprococcus sp.]
MKKRLALLMAALIGVVTIMGGCGGKESGDGDAKTEGGGDGGGTFIIRSQGDPVSFNPDTIGDDNGYPIAQNMYLRLCALDVSKQNLVPEAAKEWSYSDDAKSLTFKLREDLKWTDGEVLNSEDVKYTFDTIKATPSYYFSASMANVESIEAPDDYTVIFHMTEPDASFASILGWYATFILPEHVYNNGQPWEDNPANMEPVSCGPFMLEEYKQGESVTLVKNPDFPDQAKLDKLIFSIIPDEATAIQALKNGEIDFYENLPTASAKELEADDSIRVVYNKYPSPIRMIFNLRDEKIADLALRKAIATAVNRDEISEKVFSKVQEPEYCLYPSMIDWAANKDDVAPSFSIEEARKILEEAGYKADADGMYVTGLTIDVFEGNGYPDTAKLIQATLKEAGIGVELNVQEYNAWNQKVGIENDFQIELQGGFMGPDPVALANRIGTGQSSNWGGYSNARVDELLAMGVATSDQNERAEYYKEVQKILSEELPYFNIVSFAGPEANSARFENLPFDGEGKWAWADYSHTELVK